MTLVYNIFYNLSKLLAYGLFSMKVVHRERMVEEGPLILAVNHSSYFDPPLAGICSQRDVYYLARKSLLKWPFFGPLFPDMNVIPVERDGNDMSALREVIKKVKAGNGIVLFPEGTRSKDGNLQPAKAGIGLIIAKTKAPVLPMRIFGAFEAIPKGKKGVKFTKITVVIGHAIHFTEEELADQSRENYQKLSDRVMEEIAKLELPEKR